MFSKKMFSKIINKIFIKSPNKTIKLVVLENGRERELTNLFISVSDAESYAETAGFKVYRVIPQGRIEY